MTMHYLIELYSPKPAWLALDPQARGAFFQNIAAGMQALADHGIEAIALGQTDPAIPHGAAQQFFAIWRAADAAGIAALVAGIAASGWHDYFQTINASGAGDDLPAHLEQLATIPASALP